MSEKRINDLPEEERPREKLIKRGASSLSNAELLALFLRVGVKGASAIQVAQNLLDGHGNLKAISQLDIREMAQQHGIGPAKACQIAAAFELGRRLANESILNATLDTPESVFNHLSPLLSHQKKESLYVLLVNSRLQHERTVALSHGTLNETVCHPRDVLHPAVLHESWGFLLIHNHPTGNPAPSQADLQMTQRIEEAAKLMQVRFVDHIIIGSNSLHHSPFYSFRENGHL